MSKALRLSEAWFRRGLWAVALVFAWFLIGLGGTVVGDLPKVEQRQQLDDFMDPAATPPLRDAVKAVQRSGRDAQDALEQAQQRLKVAQADNRAARELQQLAGHAPGHGARRAGRRADRAHGPARPAAPGRTRGTLGRGGRRSSSGRWTRARRPRGPRPGWPNSSAAPAKAWSARAVPRNCASSSTAWRSRCRCWWRPAGCSR